MMKAVPLALQLCAFRCAIARDRSDNNQEVSTSSKSATLRLRSRRGVLWSRVRGSDPFGGEEKRPAKCEHVVAGGSHWLT